ncbi:MAG: Spx/MgsR family RNA polymerase-binding regulatory protein [Salinisphaeraceae bacterium]|nr:Spx/MgsR family RNA polymerase-binding regulatory protein [Salinisphaeraceae bacterium]
MTYTVYGIKACDTCRKAVRWLNEQGIEAQLYDLREDGLPKGLLTDWLRELGAESLVNRRSTTWRELDETQREKAMGSDAESILLQHPTLIKRPLVQVNGQWVNGFSARQYETLFAGAD